MCTFYCEIVIWQLPHQLACVRDEHYIQVECMEYFNVWKTALPGCRCGAGNDSRVIVGDFARLQGAASTEGHSMAWRLLKRATGL